MSVTYHNYSTELGTNRLPIALEADAAPGYIVAAV